MEVFCKLLLHEMAQLTATELCLSCPLEMLLPTDIAAGTRFSMHVGFLNAEATEKGLW